jgi:hypothetical protein
VVGPNDLAEAAAPTDSSDSPRRKKKPSFSMDLVAAVAARYCTLYTTHCTLCTVLIVPYALYSL